MKISISMIKSSLILIFFLTSFLFIGCGVMETVEMDSAGTTEDASPSEIAEKDTVEASLDSSAKTGEILVGLTDADGDFLAYTVDVVSLSLIKESGATVEVLPVSSRIDFTQYSDMTEFMTAATIPVGTYVSGSMTLDFSNADVQVEVNGVAQSAVLFNAEGEVLNGTLKLDISFEESKPLVIAPGVPAHLQLDFDLEATNEVDLSGTAPSVTVNPVLVTHVNPANLKDNRIRGLLKSTDTANESFELAIRPLHVKSGDFGSISVNTSASTIYEIDGVVYTAAEGLSKLAEKDETTPVIVIGNINIAEKLLDANEVYAGTSVPGGNTDVVQGSVISRTGDSIVVKGASILREDGSFVFNDFVTVDLSNIIKVNKQLSDEEVNKDEIYVGSFVAIFGNIEETSEGFSMAAPEFARILLSRLAGVINTASSGSIELNVKEINKRRSSIFEITNLESFTVNTSVLDTTELEANDVVQVRGFFGQSGTFNANTIVEVTNVVTSAKISWKREGTDAPFAFADSTGISIDLESDKIGEVHHIIEGTTRADLKEFGSILMILPRDDENGVFTVRSHGALQTYTTFTNFVDGINSKLDTGKQVKGLQVRGAFDSNTNTIAAFKIHVVLK